MTPDPARQLLRHTVATLAYRGGKALRGAPPSFARFQIGDTTRTPERLLAHMNDLLDWALSLARGEQRWNNSTPGAWDDEVARFFHGLTAFDAHLASDAPLGRPVEQLFQGPIADALTHVGQLMMLRRLSGAPVKSENYARAGIVAGSVGAEQAPPKAEFD